MSFPFAKIRLQRLRQGLMYSRAANKRVRPGEDEEKEQEKDEGVEPCSAWEVSCRRAPCFVSAIAARVFTGSSDTVGHTYALTSGGQPDLQGASTTCGHARCQRRFWAANRGHPTRHGVSLTKVHESTPAPFTQGHSGTPRTSSLQTRSPIAAGTYQANVPLLPLFVLSLIHI